ANQCVLECGCFGNAIPLTPWESFLKDLFLLIFVIPITIGAFTNKIKLNTTREDIIIYTASIVITALFCMLMLDWLFPVLFLVINLLVVAALKKRVKEPYKEWSMALGILVVCSIFQYYTLTHLPIKDYRAYAVGKNIPLQMKNVDEVNEMILGYMQSGSLQSVYDFLDTVELPTRDSLHYVKNFYDTFQSMSPEQKEDQGMALVEEMGKKIGFVSPVYATKFTFNNIKTGQDTVVLSTDWLKIYNEPWFKSTYKNVSYDGDEVKLQEGYEPAIQDLSLINYEGDDLTQDILNADTYVFLHISSDLSTTESDAQEDLNALAAQCERSGVAFYAVTNALYEEAEDYRHKYSAAYPFLNCDQTELKIIVRNNPGLVLIKGGVVQAKWAWRDIPSWAQVEKEFLR
ncbi:MAG: hypothetical protein KDC12_13310, partial [Flavobacteriales bacterium]|nr:hypothetical protein [Flavobacteriales bacterium]